MTTKVIINKIDGIDSGLVKLEPKHLNSKVSFSNWISENFEAYSAKEIPEGKLLPLLSYIKKLYRDQPLTKEVRDSFIEKINNLMEALKEDGKAE